MTCKKNNIPTASDSTITVRIPAVTNLLNSIKHLATGYLEKSKDLFALDEALKLGDLKKEIIGEQEDVEESPIDLDIDDELLIDQGLTVRAGGASGGNNNLLIYGALAAAGIYLLFKN